MALRNAACDLLLVKQRVVRAAQIQRRLAVFRIDLQRLFEMLDGLAVVLRDAFVIDLEALVQFIHGGLVAAARIRILIDTVASWPGYTVSSRGPSGS